MTAQAVQVPPVAGAAPVYNAAGSADTFPTNPGRHYIVHVKNASGGSINVTVTDPNSVSPGGATQFNPNVLIAVPAGAERVMVLEGTRFRDSSGNINLAFSATTSVTYAIYAML
jgi:hypothetical protein